MLKKVEDETWANYCTRTARVARKIWVKMRLPFLSDVIAESMWTVVGWVFDEKLNAVIEMKKDPYNHKVGTCGRPQEKKNDTGQKQKSMGHKKTQMVHKNST